MQTMYMLIVEGDDDFDFQVVHSDLSLKPMLQYINRRPAEACLWTLIEVEVGKDWKKIEFKPDSYSAFFQQEPKAEKIEVIKDVTKDEALKAIDIDGVRRGYPVYSQHEGDTYYIRYVAKDVATLENRGLLKPRYYIEVSSYYIPGFNDAES